MPKRLPLHDLHVAAGAKLETVDDRELPRDYGDPAAEHAAVRTGVGIVDRADLGVLEVTGRDRATFLNALLTNDLKSLAPGQGCAAALLDVHGKVQVLLAALVLEERVLLLVPPGTAEPTLEALDHYLFSEKALLRDASAEIAPLLLAGPGAPALAERLAGARPPAAAWASLPGRLDGTDVRVVTGGGETGEAEAWLLVPAEAAARAWQAAIAGGARPVGMVARESLRLEAGTPLWARDVDATVLLPEIPHASLVSHTKGCYPGQEVVVRIRDRGHVNRRLRGLVLAGDRVPAAGADVRVGDAVVGRVTSATRSLALDRPIALAFVRREHAAAGERVAVGPEGDTATVSELPFAR